MKSKLLLLTAITLLQSPLFADKHTAIRSYSTPGGKAITTFDRGSESPIGGYFDTEFHMTDGANTIKAHRLILEFSKQLHDNIFFNAEIE